SESTPTSPPPTPRRARPTAASSDRRSSSRKVNGQPSGVTNAARSPNRSAAPVAASGSISLLASFDGPSGTGILPAVAVELATLVARGHTVLVTQECQNGIVGAQSPLRELAEAAAPAMATAGRLAAAARAAGIPVVH